MSEPRVFGYIAEVGSGPELLSAAKAAYAAGYRKMDAYSPIPVHGLSEAIGEPYTKLPWIVFIVGIIGGVSGFALQYWANAIDYPLNVGGRPLNSWPASIPVTFEMIVLFAGICAVVGMLVLNRLPQPNHPIFNAKNFERASTDRFFLCIESTDPQFDAAETPRFLESLAPGAVSEVER